MPAPAPAPGPAPDHAPPGAWLYWTCPHCRTALVGKRSELGRRHVCAGCGQATTVGGEQPAGPAPATPANAAAPTTPSRATGAGPQRAPLQPAAASDTPRPPPKEHPPTPAATTPPTPPAPSQPTATAQASARAAAERRAAADAAADALRPIHATTATTAAASPQLTAPARAPLARTHRRNPPPISRRWFGLALVLLLVLLGIAAGVLFREYLPALPAPTTATLTPPAPPALPTPTAAAPALGPQPDLAAALSPTQQVPSTAPVIAPASATVVDLKPEEVYARAEAAVVVILCYKLDPERQIAIGSGFIVADENVIVTNAHVVDQADLLEIRIKSGATARLAHTLALDPHRDIAILPLPNALKKQPGLPLTTALPKIGERVFALGAPQGLDYTFTSGLISQIRREVPNFGTLLQTDASLSPGNSGGPLLNARCQVVGITTLASHAAKDANNLNFAVAAAEVQKVLDTRGDPKPLFDR